MTNFTETARRVMGHKRIDPKAVAVARDLIKSDYGELGYDLTRFVGGLSDSEVVECVERNMMCSWDDFVTDLDEWVAELARREEAS